MTPPYARHREATDDDKELSVNQPDHVEEQKDHEAALSALAQARSQSEPEQDTSVQEIVARANDRDEQAPSPTRPAQPPAAE